jgi:hypothetical protein
MFSRDEIIRAVNLQRRSYELLRWVASAIGKGFISFNAAHAYTSLSSSAEAWIQRHYSNIPETARPPIADLKEFSGLFVTYLENSFELARNPGRRLYSPDAHCFCPMCSWLIDAPNLRTKTPTTRDKNRARKMMLDIVNSIAVENGIRLSEKAIEAILADPNLREELALCAYGVDLLRRMRGVAIGAATLVLWRNFAWLPTGSPKKNFELTADLILGAEQALRERILSEAVH